MRVLFVCMGNICRSPTAEAVFARLLRQEGLEDEIAVDSAGTGAWHVGEPPDPRATRAAAARGIALTGAARQVRAADFADFDRIVAMDAENARDLRALAPDAAAAEKVVLLRQYDPAAVAAGDLDVRDPYPGGPDGFEQVLDDVERAARGLLDDLR